MIVGAGPAGIAAAISLLHSKFRGRITILERGRPHARRVCPVDHGRACKGCGGVCNVLSGFAGAIHYGDSVKLSRFPAGRRLRTILGPQADDAMDSACAIIEEALGRSLSFTESPESLTPPPAEGEYRAYPVATVSGADGRRLVERLFAMVGAGNDVSVRLGTSIVALESEAGGYCARICDRAGNEESVFADFVVVAVGRAGLAWWHGALRMLAVAHELPDPSVGLRFEMDRSWLEPAGVVHPDFKMSFSFDAGKFKSFCFCAGSGGGRVKFGDYGDFTLLDGHVSTATDPIPQSGAPANFALLYQLRDVPNTDRLAYVRERFIDPYARLRPSAPGKPVCQRYGDFRRRKAGPATWPELRATLRHTPSVDDLSPGRLDSLFDDELHRAFCRAFESFMATVTAFAGGIDGDAMDAVLVIGLELEGLWDVIHADSNLETSRRNLFVAGDALGAAQGILQAMSCGIVAGRKIASLTRDDNPRPSDRDRIVYDRYWTTGNHYAPSDTFVEMIDLIRTSHAEPLRIADLGCGLGRHALYAADRGVSVTAVDYSDRAVARLRENRRDARISVVKSDFREWLPSTEQREGFHGIVCFDALHHVSSRSNDVGEFMTIVRRRVCPGGFILVTLLADIDYGDGDWPAGRLMITVDEAEAMMTQRFDGTTVLRSKHTAVHFDNTVNLNSATKEIVRTHYSATRVIKLFQVPGTSLCL